MNRFLILYLVGIAMGYTSCSKKSQTVLKKQKFNENWVFKRLDTPSDTAFFYRNSSESDWIPVTLPHTTQLEPKVVQKQWQGVSWYRKKFSIPPEMEGKRLFLKFEGAMNIAEVWINEKKMIRHQGGYLPFVIDMTEAVDMDSENTIAVRLDNRDNPITGPKPLQKLDFNTYGGIYRNVWLVAKNRLYITDPILENKTASGGVFVRYSKVTRASAIARIQTHVRNTSKRTLVYSVRNTLLDNDGKSLVKVSKKVSIAANSEQEMLTNLEVKNPKLWGPQHPNLYTLSTELLENGIVVDRETQKIGFKNIEFKGQDLYLNGEKIFLRGVNRHQEYPHIGYALSDNAQYRDAYKIKEAGFDYVRLSHYPHSTAFMEACDVLGLLTIDAILGWQYFSEDPKFQEQVFQTARNLIRRDRNHPSVLAWEVSLNESWMPEVFIDSLTAIAHKEYPGKQCFTAGWQSYGYDMYLQARQHRLQHYDPSIQKPYNVSEYGDWEYYAMNAGLQQDSWSGLLQKERSSRQLRTAGETALLQQATNIQEAHNDNLKTPAFADGYWVMFDYNRGYADDLEASGIMDIYRIPKPAYYFFKSQRSSEEFMGAPMVQIANNWTENSPLQVRVFSNCDAVALFLNGKKLGLQKPDVNRTTTHLKHPPFTFQIQKFQKGVLEAHAYIKDSLVASHSVRTPEAPNRIEVQKDTTCKDIKKGTLDIHIVHAVVKDTNGTLVPNFDGEILFSVEGDKNAEWIGENPVACEAGIASILIKTRVAIDSLKIKATSEKLDSLKRNQNAAVKFMNEVEETDSMGNIPKHFSKLQNKYKDYCMVRGAAKKRQIALTFDDGPSAFTRKILKVLNAHKAKGTFFWQGDALHDKEVIVELTQKSGHLIANHSWDHSNGWEMANQVLWETQIEKTFDTFKKYGIENSKLFRPPFGGITEEQIDFLKQKEVKTVLWSLTTRDWDTAKNHTQTLFETFKNNLHNGAIVLLHDVAYGKESDLLMALEKMLLYGESLGYDFVTVQKISENNL
ncbi:MAG: polysaccharide deacetylase family protein [Flavicella sp.]